MGAHSRSYEVIAVRRIVFPLVQVLVSIARTRDPMTKTTIYRGLSTWVTKTWGGYLDDMLGEDRPDYPLCEIDVKEED